MQSEESYQMINVELPHWDNLPFFIFKVLPENTIWTPIFELCKVLERNIPGDSEKEKRKRIVTRVIKKNKNYSGTHEGLFQWAKKMTFIHTATKKLVTGPGIIEFLMEHAEMNRENATKVITSEAEPLRVAPKPSPLSQLEGIEKVSIPNLFSGCAVEIWDSVDFIRHGIFMHAYANGKVTCYNDETDVVDVYDIEQLRPPCSWFPGQELSEHQVLASREIIARREGNDFYVYSLPEGTKIPVVKKVYGNKLVLLNDRSFVKRRKIKN